MVADDGGLEKVVIGPEAWEGGARRPGAARCTEAPGRDRRLAVGRRPWRAGGEPVSFTAAPRRWWAMIGHQVDKK